MARTLAIGDIHGCYTALLTLVEFVSPSENDTLITLGDYVDRGRNSYAVMDWVMHFTQLDLLIPLRGNHEVMMSKAREDEQHLKDWLAVGGREALRSYAPLNDDGKLSDIPEEHFAFLESSLRPYHETESHIFVHGMVYPELPLDEQPDYMLYWEQFHNPPRHESGKIIVCGHTPQRDGLQNATPTASASTPTPVEAAG